MTLVRILIACSILLNFSVSALAAPGDLDMTFNVTGKVTTAIGSGDDNGNAVAVQSDGKILVAGSSYNGTNDDFALVRYNVNGSLDPTFGTGGKVTTAIGGSSDAGWSVAVQGDGKILVAGESWNGTNLDFALVRYNVNGSLDTTFGTGGNVTTPINTGGTWNASVAVQGDGKILVVGNALNHTNATNTDIVLVRYNVNGSLDSTFNNTGKVTTSIGTDAGASSVAVQSDGKILVAGTSSNGTNSVFALVRYNVNGSADTSFNNTGTVTTAIGTDAGASAIALQSDGKILLAGDSRNVSNWDFTLARYNVNGSLDMTFNGTGTVITAIGSGYDNGYGVAVQSDGNILVAGDSSNGLNYDFALVRYLGGSATQTGSLTVNIVPAEAASAGAQWRVDGGAWQNSGNTITGLSGGSHVVVFSTLKGWPTPTSQTVTINGYMTIVGTYVLIPNADLDSLLPSVPKLVPAFSSATTAYTTTVPKSALYFTVTPTVAQAGATVRVSAPTLNGGNPVSVSSGSASPQIPLNIGATVITTVVTATGGVLPPKTYKVTVTRASTAPVTTDLTGSGKPDLIFQNTFTGQVEGWFLNGSGAPVDFGTGSGIISSGTLYGGSLVGWRVAGVADVNGDGNPDLVFQNIATGQVYAFFLDGSGAAVDFGTGAGIKGADYLYGGSLIGWRLAGIADVNNDGIPDMVFQNETTGQLQAWLLDGTGANINFATHAGFISTGWLYRGSLIGWRLAGIANVNNDGIPDLVFQSTGTGQLYAWLLDGSGADINFTTLTGLIKTGTSAFYLYGGSLIGWKLVALADMNRDGIPDLLFQNETTGEVYAWFLDGTGASIGFSPLTGIKSASFLYSGNLSGWELH